MRVLVVTYLVISAYDLLILSLVDGVSVTLFDWM